MFKLAISCFIVSLAVPALGDDLYAPKSADDTRAAVLKWAESHPAKTTDKIAKIKKMWSDAEGMSARKLQELTVQSFVVIDEGTRKLVAAAAPAKLDRTAPLDEYDELNTDNAFHANNVRAWFAKRLSQSRLYDEALEICGETEAKHVVDPASYFFFQSVSYQQLINTEGKYVKEAFAALSNLMKNTEDVPPRYATVARLMEYELKQIAGKQTQQQLAKTAQMMKDSGRRLDLTRAGSKVQNVQEKIVASLDEIIEKLEQQSGGGGGGGGGGSGEFKKPSGPADSPYEGGVKGDGKTDRREFTERDPWGSLPPKERARHANILDKKLPAHYRTRIESYAEAIAKHKKGKKK